MQFLHSMIRVYDIDSALHFFVDLLGLKEVRRRDSEKGRFTLIFLETQSEGDRAQIELTYNWDQTEAYSGGRNFGHCCCWCRQDKHFQKCFLKKV